MAGARSYRFRLVIQTVTEPRELAPQQRLAAEPPVDRPVDQRRIERLAGLGGDDHVSDRTLTVETAGVAVRGHLGAGRGQKMHIPDLAVSLLVLGRTRNRIRLVDRPIVPVSATDRPEPTPTH